MDSRTRDTSHSSLSTPPTGVKTTFALTSLSFRNPIAKSKSRSSAMTNFSWSLPERYARLESSILSVIPDEGHLMSMLIMTRRSSGTSDRSVAPLVSSTVCLPARMSASSRSAMSG